MPQQPQKRQFGPYSLGQRLGLGGMAEVLEAKHPQFGRVALKRILPALKGDPKFIAMFEDEARVTSAVKHPNVVHVHEYSHYNNEPFLALELVDGPDVSRVVRSAARKELSWNLGRALSLPFQLLSGLEAVHACRDSSGQSLNLVHRDISPGNLILQSSGGLKIGDFGIASGEEIERRTEPGQLKGKLGYMSPEQALGESPAQSSDLYSAGIIAAELLMLRPLFRAASDQETLKRNTKGDISNWTQFGEHLPDSLRKFIAQSLNPNPRKRYHSAGEMLQALVHAAAGAGQELTREVAHDCVADTLREIKAKSGSFRATELLRAFTNSSEDKRAPIQKRAKVQSVEDTQQEGPVTEADDRLARPLYTRLAELSEAQTTARVMISNAQHWLEILIAQGSITSCLSSTNSHQLGELLVQEGIILARDLPVKLREARAEGLRLGELLIQRKKVTERVIARLLAVQIKERLAPWICQRGVDIEVFDSTESQHLGHAPTCLNLLNEVLRKNISSTELSICEQSIRANIIWRSNYYSAHEYQEKLVDMACTQAEYRILNLIPARLGASLRADWYQNWQEERIATRHQLLTAIWIGLEAGLLSLSPSQPT